MAIDSDCDLLMWMGNNMAMDMDSGDIHLFPIGWMIMTMTIKSHGKVLKKS